MAEYDLKIASARMDMVYAQTPAPSAPALAVLSFYQNAQISTNSTTYQYTSALPTPLFIPAASFVAGTKYMVFVQASFGGATVSTVGEVSLVSNRGLTPTIHAQAIAESNVDTNPASDVPESMRAAQLCRGFIFIPDGTDLEISYRSLGGQNIWVSGISCTAIPMETNYLTENDDWFSKQIEGDLPAVTASGGTEVAVDTATFDLVDSGGYMMYVSCAGRRTNTVEDIHFTVELNGTRPFRQYNKESEDARDTHNYFFSRRLSLLPGINTIKIIGWSTKTGYNRYFYRPSILLVKEAAWDYVDSTEQVGALYVNGVAHFPSWEIVQSKSFAPPTDTQLFVVGGMFARNTGFGSCISGLSIDGTGFSAFASDANITGFPQDEVTLGSFGMKDVNTAVTCQLLFTQGTQLGAQAQYVDAHVIAWSLRPVSAGVNLYVSIVDNVSVADGTTGPTDPLGVSETDSATVADTVSAITSNPSSGGPSLTRPRLWFSDPNMLNDLRTAAGYDNNGVQVNPPGSQFWQDFLAMKLKNWEGWHYAVKWKVTQNPSDLALAISGANSQLGRAITQVDGLCSSNGLYYRDHMRNMCICYDLLYDQIDANTKYLWRQFILALTFVVMNNNSPLSQALADTDDWATNNPQQNYFSAQQLGVTYASIALYGENAEAEGWTWPPGSGSANAFWLRYNNRDLSSQVYTDLWQYTVDRFDTMGLPKWDGNIFTLNGDRGSGPNPGGGWHEGGNYGRAALRHQWEAFVLLKLASGIDYINNPNHAWIKETTLHQLFECQPGFSRVAHLGDNSGAPNLTFNAYNRHLVLLSSYALPGSLAGAYGQWALDNEMPTTIQGSIDEMQVWDFFLHRNNAAVDYRGVLIPGRTSQGIGFVNSRDVWGSDAVSVIFTCQDNLRPHTHQDQGGLQIWIGGQGGVDESWALCDARALGTGGGTTNISHSSAHNCLVVGGHAGGQIGSPVGSNATDGNDTDNPPPYYPTGVLERSEHTIEHSYAHGNMDNGYRIQNDGTNPGYASYGDQVLLDNYTRDFLHIRKTNGYVVAFDRCRVSNNWVSDSVATHWNVPAVSAPVAVAPGVYRNDHATNARLFLQFFLPKDVWGQGLDVEWVDMSGSYGTSIYQGRHHLNGFGVLFPDRFLCTVLQPTKTTTASPVLVEELSVASGDVLGGNIWGIVIRDPVQYEVVIFSLNIDASPVASMQYNSPKGPGLHRHLICNLTPGLRYERSVADFGTYFWVDFHENPIGTYVASAAGTVRLDPAVDPPSADLVTIIDYANVSDDPIVPHSVVPITDNVRATDSWVVAPIGGGTFVVSITDEVNVSDSLVPSSRVPIIDQALISDSNMVTNSTPQPEGVPSEVEKLIPKAFVVLVPDGDRDLGPWRMEPLDNIMWDKINNTVDTPDDSRFVDGSEIGWFGSAEVSLTNPIVAVTGERARMRIRTREVNLTEGVAGNMKMTLKRGTTVVWTENIEFQSGSIPKNLQTGWFDITSLGNNLNDLNLNWKTVLTGQWSADTKIELSELDVYIEHSGFEKVI